jgi:hypothetical protein
MTRDIGTKGQSIILPMSLVRKAVVCTGAAVLAAGIGYVVLHEYVRAAAFVIQAAGMEGVVSAIADIETSAVSERTLRIPWRGGELPARWYSADNASHSPILLVPGVHAAGLDEPRLVGLARDLASVGHHVLTT